jgi:hypothetical protein
LKKSVLLALLILSVAACSGPDKHQMEVNPTLIDISRQTLVAELQQTAIVEHQILPTLQPTINSLPTVGSITGTLSYPSEFLPGLLIIAYRSGTTEYYSISTLDSQGTYQMDNLPSGTYHVVAYYQSLSAGFSQAVPCGLRVDCTDHNLIDVVVMAGNVTMGVNPTDWYAPAGAFPAKPY